MWKVGKLYSEGRPSRFESQHHSLVTRLYSDCLTAQILTLSSKMGQYLPHVINICKVPEMDHMLKKHLFILFLPSWGHTGE